MKVNSKQQLYQILLDCKDAISSLGVGRLGVFGSFVRDQPSAASDVDLLVEFVPGKKTFDNFVGLAELVEDRTGRRVELVTMEGLSPYIGPRILKEVEYLAI